MSTENQNILFLVTGMTPAIITETIWALACDPTLSEASRWIPNRIEVLSTEHGLNQIRSRLLSNNIIEKLKQDFPQLSQMVFDETCLTSINDEKEPATALVDLKTPEDNEYAANQINERIRHLTEKETTSLHVSIAGGRKTMGFYAGYALSLHGRAQDRMSHVLVDNNFENIQDFYYPTPNASYVTDRNDNAWDASKARIWLAEIPFVRMKDGIKKNHTITNDSFIEAVQKINQANQPIQLNINVSGRTIALINQEKTFTLPPKQFAFFCMFAESKRKDEAGFLAPRKNLTEPNLDPADVNYINELSQAFKFFYNQLRHEDYLDERDIDVGKDYFEEVKSNLKKTLEKELGLELAARLTVIQKKRGQPFYLAIPSSAITIDNNK